MAKQTTDVTLETTFPAGAVVGVYSGREPATHGRAPGSEPLGPRCTEAKVFTETTGDAVGNRVTYKGLTKGEPYVAATEVDGEWRQFGFTAK